MKLRIEQISRGLRHFNRAHDFYYKGLVVLVGDAVLCHKMALKWGRHTLWTWWRPVRTVPAWEWAKAAFGDNYIPDSL